VHVRTAVPHVRASDAELDRISEEQRKLARVFLTYILEYPIVAEDLVYMRDRILEAMGNGYRVDTSFTPERGHLQIFAPSGVRIRDQVMLARGIPAPPRA
jgi:hypothetical protein